MRKIFFLLLVLLISKISFSQMLDDLKKSSYYTYIFELTQEEAELLYTKGIDKLQDSFFHTLADSFLTEKKYKGVLENGYYLKASTHQNKLNYSLTTIQDFDVKIIDNNTDLIIQLIDNKSKTISDANVYLKGKRLKFDKKISAYKKRRSNKQGLLKVEYKGLVCYYQLRRQYNNSKLKRVYQKVVWGTPIKYVWRPVHYAINLPVDGVKSLFKWRFVGYAYRTRYFYRNWNYRINNFINNLDDKFDFENRYESFIVFNKPKYKPNDTVKFKAFIVNRRGKPLKKDVILKFHKTSSKSAVSKIIKPYARGGFENEFILHDSLDLTLDKKYMMFLVKPRTRIDKKLNIHKRYRKYTTSYIKYEDYELHQNKLSLKTNTKNQFKGNDLEVLLKGTDENNLNLQDARYELVVLAKNKFNFFDNFVFVPNVLFKKNDKLLPTGETKIIIPDSIIPKANFTYEIKVRMLTSDNELKTKNKNIHYYYKHEKIKYDFKHDSINIWYEDLGIRKSISAKIIVVDNLNNEIIADANKLPASIKLYPNSSKIIVETKNINETINIDADDAQLKCYTKINKDSLFIKVLNPAKLNFSYFFYKHNSEIKRGYTDSLTYKIKHPGKKEYLFSIQYFWGGKMHTQNYGISRKNNKAKLYVKLEKPNLVFPGQKSKIKIEVKDSNGKPVKDVDVTSFGLTKKFNYHSPQVPNLAKKTKRKYKEHINSFHFNKIKEKNVKTLNYRQWKRIAGLDSMEYYKFLYPGKNIYKTTYTAPDSITQFSPYVLKKGAFQKVHIVFVDNNPVYFSWMTNVSKYSFKIDSGYHRVKIRLNDAVLVADSIYFQYGKKTIISLEKDYKNKKNRKVWKVGNKIRNQRVLAKHIFPYRYNFSSSLPTWREKKDIFAYIEQKDNFIMLNPKKHSNLYLAGPINNYRIYFNLIDGFKLDFVHEPNFEFDILPNILKMRSKTNKQIFPEYLNNKNAIFKTNDFVIDKKQFYKLYEKHLFEKRYKDAKYYNPRHTYSDKGSLHIDYIANKKVNNLFADIILLKKGQNDFVRIYQGNSATFHNLSEGLYKMIFLYADSSYHQVDSVKVKKNGYNYCKINEPDSLKKDEFSKFAFALIRDNILINSKDTKEYEKYRIKKEYDRVYKYYDKGDIIDGFVTDESGEPLPGVTVIVKGTDIATMTDIRGYYSMSVPYDADKLVFSYIGFENQEKDIDPYGENNAIFYDDGLADLEEVVVTGMGVRRASKSVAYSVTSVQGESVNLLNGKIAGIETVNSNYPKIKTVSGQNHKLKDNGNEYDESFFNNISDVSALRTNFSDYAFWQPKLRTDKNGLAEFEVKFPDDITNWDIITYAINGKRQTGQAKSNIKSYKPLSARLYLPRFILKGDSANAIGKSINYLTNSAKITSEFHLNDSLIFEKDSVCKTSVVDTLLLFANNSDTLKVKYLLKAKNGYFDGEERKIPVFPVGMEKAKGTFDVFDKDTSINYVFNKNMEDVYIYAKKDALGVLEDEIGTLIHYLHSCNEQMASKLKAMLFDKQICEFKGKKFTHEKEVKKLIKLLSKNQNDKGLWGWWGKSKTEMWISTHVLEALLNAEKLNYKVPINKDNIISNLELKLEELEYYDSYHVVPTLKLLKYLNAEINYAYFIKKIDEFEKKHKTVKPVNFDLIEIKQICGLPTKIDFLKNLRNENFFGNVYYFYEEKRPSYIHLNRNIEINNNTLTLKAYKILRNDSLTDKNELLKIRNYLFEQRKSGTWRNTYESAKIIETLLPDLLKTHKTYKPAKLIISGSVDKTINKFPFKMKLKSTDSISISKKGSEVVYFTTYQKFWDAKPKKRENNFIIKTSFNNNDTLINLKAGQKVKLTVSLEVLEDAKYVMLDIPIPAGCSYNSKKQYYYNEVHREYRKQKTNIYSQKLNKGFYTFEIDLLPRYTGKYTLNPAKVELMYFPTFYANTEIKKVLIK